MRLEHSIQSLKVCHHLLSLVKKWGTLNDGFSQPVLLTKGHTHPGYYIIKIPKVPGMIVTFGEGEVSGGPVFVLTNLLLLVHATCTHQQFNKQPF